MPTWIENRKAFLIEATVGNMYGNFMKIRSDGSIGPPCLVDKQAKNNSIYFSKNRRALVYKDDEGFIHPLYPKIIKK